MTVGHPVVLLLPSRHGLGRVPVVAAGRSGLFFQETTVPKTQPGKLVEHFRVCVIVASGAAAVARPHSSATVLVDDAHQRLHVRHVIRRKVPGQPISSLADPLEGSVEHRATNRMTHADKIGALPGGLRWEYARFGRANSSRAACR